MPHTHIWIHLVFATKNRQPFLIPSIRQKVFQHMMDNAQSKGIVVSCISGYYEHVHVLLRLLPTQNLSKVVQLIKGESAFWINANQITAEHFDWQDDYFAISVGRQELAKVFNYISNQEKRHASQTFNAEFELMRQRYPDEN